MVRPDTHSPYGASTAALATTCGHTVAVSGYLVGPAVSAVLIPPQAERFAALAGVDPGRLVLNVTGWNKLVLRWRC